MKKICYSFILLSFLFLISGCEKKEERTILVDDNKVKIENNEKIVEEKTPLDKYIGSLTIEEKIGQMILLMAPVENKFKLLESFPVAGFVYGFHETVDHTKESLKKEFQSLQEASHIPLLFSVDEEGGTVTRISHNKNFSDTVYESPKNIYQKNGWDGIIKDIKTKSAILEELGFLLNFAPVLDVASDKNSYMWNRSFSSDYTLTSTYAKTVIETSKDYNVTYTLKHFPGHGDYEDTHGKEVIDTKSLEEYLKKDFKPFIAGIDAGAEAVMLDHITMTSLDKENPASISKNVIDYLKKELHFDGLVITDALNMIRNENKYEKAILAGNDLLIIANYYEAFEEIKNSIKEGRIKEEDIIPHVKRVLEWKIKHKILTIE